GVLHAARREQLGDIVAGTEETTTGVIRLKALEREGKLGFPIIAVNEAKTKHLFDNRYGWVGRGVAMRARGMGSHVIVTEVDAMRALEAVMDGFQVLPMSAAAARG